MNENEAFVHRSDADYTGVGHGCYSPERDNIEPVFSDFPVYTSS